MLLKDKSLQDELQKNGFVVIPFLDSKETEALNSFYDDIHQGAEPPNFLDNIHMTTWCKEADYKAKVSENLKTIFEAASNRFFQNYRRLNNVFIVKRSGRQTTFKVHQDWSIVDENKYESVNVWVPLHDVDVNSGALWVLKGSHQINRKVRGAGYLFPDYGPFFTELEKKAISVKLNAGQAIVFYHSVIHGSPPNIATGLRKAACFSVIPKEAPLCIYFQPSAGDQLKQYEPDDEFVYKYDQLRTESLTKPPAGQPVNVLPAFENKKVMSEELAPFLKTKTSLLSFFRK